MKTQRMYLLCALVTMLSLSSQPLRADSTKLADLLQQLFVTDVVLAPPTGPFPSHEAHFVANKATQQTFFNALNDSAVSQLATFPVGLGSAGFTFTFDPELGVFTRSAESFGPVYAERAHTLGKGRWNYSVSYQQAEYDSIDDLDLLNGEIRTQLTHEDTDASGDPITLFFEGDVIENRAKIGLTSKMVLLAGTYGVTDRFDVGVVIPIVSVELDAVSGLEVIQLGTTPAQGIHAFPGGGDVQTRRAKDNATGIGDVLLRGKYRFWGHERAGWAVASEIRLPTGDEDELLGTGETQFKVLLIGSATIGKFSPHLNFGFTKARDLPDEINYALGFDVALRPRVTFIMDLVGRSLLDATKATLEDQTFLFNQVPPPGTPVVESTVRPVLATEEDDINQLFAAVGVKFNPGGNAVVTVNALVSVRDDGLEDEDPILLFAYDRSF